MTKDLERDLLQKINSIPEFFDVIIIGGGPAGAAAAITLSCHGIRTAIIERSSYNETRIGETMPPAIHNPLISLGLWDKFLEDGHIKSYAIHSSWGVDGVYENEHIYNPNGSGWHIDRTRFDQMLAIGATNAGAFLFTDAHIKHLSQDKRRGWQITVSQFNHQYLLQAPFLIDATGRTGTLTLGLPRVSHVIDRLIGIAYFFDKVSEPYTLIESVSNGWWYSAPLPGDRMVVVHMTDADLFASSGCTPYDYWFLQIAKTKFTSIRIGSQIVINKPKIVSAASIVRRPICGNDWIATGDACLAFDPLAGQGIHNALKGGIFAAKTIITHINGDSESFTEYAKRMENQFSNYLQMRYVFYSKEQRWSQNPFWIRRNSSLRISENKKN